MLSSTPTTRPLTPDPAVAMDARKTLTYLASDELEGRGVGTKGLDLAADYIARRFGSLGLQTVPGNQDYFQPFQYTVSTTLGEATFVKLNGKAIEKNKDYLPVGISREGAFDADAVFVGYGISEPEKYHYDDYADIDVKGKVVVALRYEPRDEKGNSRFTSGDWSPAAALTAKASAAASHGAAALVLVNPPVGRNSGSTTAPATAPTSAPAESPTTQLALAPTTEPSTQPATQPATQPTARSGRRGGRRSGMFSRDSDPLIGFSSSFGGRAGIPVVQIKQSAINEFLEQLGEKDLKTLQTGIDESGKPASHALPGDAKIAGKVDIQRKQAQIKNVMAVLPGKGPNADEYIVVGAHYDHLGRGMMGSMVPGSKEIHHGADDNGSGTTAILELATKLARGPRLSRSVLFITFTAEEEGLIGSDHFVDHPPVPLDRIVAMLNLDMVGRVKNDVLFVGGSGTAAPFDDMLRHADELSPLEIKYIGPMVGKGGMGPSDHQTFAMKKIPVLFFFSGMHPDYHTPTDTADKINYDGLAESVALGEYLVRQMARMPRQQYVATYDRMSTFSGGRGGGVTLGIIPDYNAADSSDGVKIMGTREGSPAAAAGLKEGDVIVRLGEKKIASIYDLTDFLADAKAGQTVKATVQRDGNPVELSVTFAARGG
jgi:hypothetical protein